MIGMFIAAGVLIGLWAVVTRLSFWLTVGLTDLEKREKVSKTASQGLADTLAREDELAAKIQLGLRGMKKKD